jgi:hypothetical protein
MIVYSELPALVSPVFRLKDSKLTQIRRPSADITLVHLSKLLLGPFFLNLKRSSQHEGDEVSKIQQRSMEILNELGVNVSLQGWVNNSKESIISLWKDQVQSREPANLLLCSFDTDSSGSMYFNSLARSFVTSRDFGTIYETAERWAYAMKICSSNLAVLTSKNDDSGYDPAISEPDRYLRLSQTKVKIESFRNALSAAWYDKLKVFGDAVASNKADMAKLDRIHEAWEDTNHYFLKENTGHVERLGFGAIQIEYHQDSLYKQCLNVYFKALAACMDELRSAASIPQG